MANGSGFRIRLCVRLAKGLTTEATTLSIVVANREVTLTSQNKDEPLSKAKWVIFSARAFKNEEDAQKFGTQLSSMLQLAAVPVGNQTRTYR